MRRLLFGLIAVVLLSTPSYALGHEDLLAALRRMADHTPPVADYDESLRKMIAAFSPLPNPLTGAALNSWNTQWHSHYDYCGTVADKSYLDAAIEAGALQLWQTTPYLQVQYRLDFRAWSDFVRRTREYSRTVEQACLEQKSRFDAEYAKAQRALQGRGGAAASATSDDTHANAASHPDDVQSDNAQTGPDDSVSGDDASSTDNDASDDASGDDHNDADADDQDDGSGEEASPDDQNAPGADQSNDDPQGDDAPDAQGGQTDDQDGDDPQT